MDKKFTVIAAVVVVIAVIAAAAMVMMSGDDDDEYVVNETGRLMVFGNANNDDYIDQHDIDFVQAIVDGEADWDEEANEYADANNDGRITQADVEQIQNIIDRKTVTLWYKEYYESLSYNVTSVTWPMKTDSIGVYQYQAGILVNFLGLWDNVDYADDSTIASTMMLDTEGIKSYGAYSGSAMRTESALETFRDSEVDVLILNGYWDDTVVKDGLRNMGSDIQVIKPYSQGTYCLGSIVTFGFLLDAYDNAMEYISFYEKAQSYLDDRLGGMPESEQISYYVVGNPKDVGSITIRSSGSNGVYPDLAWVMTLPGENKMPVGDDNKYQAKRTAEWFQRSENAVDFLILSVSGLGGDFDYDMKAAVDKYSEMFVQTDMYKSSNIVGFNYAYFNGLYAPGLIVLLASFLYPDQVDSDYAWELFEDFFDKYDVNGSDAAKKYAGIYMME